MVVLQRIGVCGGHSGRISSTPVAKQILEVSRVGFVCLRFCDVGFRLGL